MGESQLDVAGPAPEAAQATAFDHLTGPQARAAKVAANASASRVAGKGVAGKGGSPTATKDADPAGATAPTLTGEPSAEPEPLGPPTLRTTNCEGQNQTQQGTNIRPPDTHGAVGPNHYVEVVNVSVNVYTRACGLQLHADLNTFFNRAELLFDPRVIYDSTWNRWVIIATRRSSSPTDTVRAFFVAVSTGPSPTGSFHKYTVGFGGGPFANGVWADYPQVGLDQDAILMTSSFFTNANAFVTAGAWSLPKARLYNGFGFNFPIFSGLQATVAPPLVTGAPFEQTADSFFASINCGSDRLIVYAMRHSENPTETTLIQDTNVPYACDVPPDADQFGTPVNLDTLDGRIQNTIGQRGDRLHIVHTRALGGFPAPYYVEVNTTSNAILQIDSFFASGTSHDWNPAVAVGPNGHVYITYSSTDPPAPLAVDDAQVRVTGRLATDPVNSIGAGSSIFQSAVAYTDGLASGSARWGDYSAVSIDPLSAANRAWVVNQKTNSATVWGSRFALIGF